MSIKKSIAKLLSNHAEMQFKEISRILVFFGYKLNRIKGSHYQFTKHGEQIITIAVHKKKIEKFYLKIVKKAIIKEITANYENL